jgi:hypothetical protein
MHSLLYRAVAGIVMVVSFYFAIQLSQSGFKTIQDFRQLERIVPSPILGVLSGEAQVEAYVEAPPDKPLLRSTKQKVPSVYFRYLKERQETDSEGKTRWVTEADITRAMSFDLQDHSSSASVLIAGNGGGIRWSMPASYSERQGDYRYTEWRIEPGQSVLIYGWAEVTLNSDSEPSIHFRFDREGRYLPIISKFSAAEERGSLGTDAILHIWGGVSLYALAICASMYLFQIHRLLAYLSLMTCVTSAALLGYGYTSMSTNVQAGAAYVSEKQRQAESEIQAILGAGEVFWPGWENLGQLVSHRYRESSWKAQRITEIRLNLFYLDQMYGMQIAQFPENAYASLSGHKTTPQVAYLNEQERHVAQGRLANYEKTSVKETRYLFMAGGGFVLFIVLAYFGFRYAKVKRMIENIPTSKTKGVAFGTVELKGNVGLIEGHSLLGPVTFSKCVWYRYLVQEKRGSGKRSKWVTLTDDTKGIRFYCEDSEGELLIDASDAEVITRHKKVRRSGDKRYTEWALNDGDAIYALGQASVDPVRPDHLFLNKPRSTDTFILSNYSERDIMIRKATKAMLSLLFAFSSIFFFATFLNGVNGQFSAFDYFVSGLIGPVFLIAFTIVLHYNDIVFLKQRASRNWANIQVALKKRADLFKQLERVVRRYLQHEKALLQELAELRTRSSKRVKTAGQAAKQIQSEQRFVKALNVKLEAYPDLKADEVVQEFFDTMTAMENEIALMRHGFNDAVREYNTRIQSFPDVLLTRIFKFKQLTLLSFDK